MDPTLLPVAKVTAAWVFMSYIFMPMGPTASMARVSDGQVKWGDRTFMNMNEQSPHFLVSLWIHAIFVSAQSATYLGIAYLVLRFLYPCIWALKGTSIPPFPEMFLSTFPQYAINIYMMLSLFLPLKAIFLGWDALGVVVVFIIYICYCVVFTMKMQTWCYARFFNRGQAELR